MPTEAEAGDAPVPSAEGGGQWIGSGTHIRVNRLDPNVRFSLGSPLMCARPSALGSCALDLREVDSRQVDPR